MKLTESIETLEDRMRHVEFLVNGDISDVEVGLSSNENVVAALKKLEYDTLQMINANEKAASIINQITSKLLQECTSWLLTLALEVWPEIQSNSKSPEPEAQTLSDTHIESVLESQLDLPSQVISLCEQLLSLEIPSTRVLAEATDLKLLLPRIFTELDQILRVSDELSVRSANVLQVWIQGVIRENSKLAEWDNRLRLVEQRQRQNMTRNVNLLQYD